MIVSAGYFSSSRAPSFQSSHETARHRAVTPQAPLSLLPANQVGIHTLRSSSPHMSVHRAMLIEPADGSIPPRTSQCLHVEVSIP